MMRSLRRALLAVVVALAAIGSHPAHASEAPSAETPFAALGAEDAARLARGETVTRPQTIDADDRHYVGGVTYTIVDTSPDELASVLEDVHAWRKVLPRTKQALLVGEDGPDFFVELRQGTSLMEAKYTLRARKDPAHHEVRFWLDKRRPHGIADAWGFFHYEAVPTPTGSPRTLVTYGVLVDVGPGIVRELFEERLRGLMLSVPQLLQHYVAKYVRARPQGLASLAPN